MISFPLWQELPDLDLYLDQVLLYVNSVNQKAFPGQEKVLTAAMINNYVKHAQDIIETVEYLVKNQESSELFYNQFVGYMNEETDIEIHPLVSSACQTVKLYHQTRQLSLELKGAHANESNHEIK